MININSGQSLIIPFFPIVDATHYWWQRCVYSNKYRRQKGVHTATMVRDLSKGPAPTTTTEQPSAQSGYVILACDMDSILMNLLRSNALDPQFQTVY